MARNRQNKQNESMIQEGYDESVDLYAMQKKKKKQRRRLIFFLIELGLLAVMVFLLLQLYKDKIVPSEDPSDLGEPMIKEETIVPGSVGIPTEVLDDPVRQGYRNIALFGVDVDLSADDPRTAILKGFRSDTIMIANINLETYEIKLVSVFRDTYLNIGDGEYGKVNGAYHDGGDEQALKALNENLDLDITEFITVSYHALAKTIDGLGGVWVSVEQEEISFLNDYQISVAKIMGIDNYPSKKYPEVTEAGYQLLNGMQAAAYCRIRGTKGSDYKRTERQREVVKAMEAAAKEASLSKLIEIYDAVDGYIYTSFEATDVLDFLPLIVDKKVSIVSESTFPLRSMVYEVNLGSGGAAVVVPNDLAQNVIELHKFLYGENPEYRVPDLVKRYNQEIINNTDEYVRAKYGSQ
ncbi:MAG: LCP family protein [Lachnospiraceae bacterium]|jgi:LCP family protein required for cell wall assembly|nr:LCP family protein [Lachnospiraceae bacterium]